MEKLEEHNKRFWKNYSKFKKIDKTKSGVLCSKCKTEMIIENPNVINASNPPSQWVKCLKCGERSLKY